MKKAAPQKLQRLIEVLEEEFGDQADPRNAEILEILKESKRRIELLGEEADGKKQADGQ